jgi:hypothetical protein
MYDDLVVRCVSTVIGVFLPILDVDICDPPNKKFKFALIEDIDKVLRNQLVEAGYESLELLLNSFLNTPFCDKTIKLAQELLAEGDAHLLNVFSLVLVRDLDLLTTWLHLDADSFAEPLVFRRKCKF